MGESQPAFSPSITKQSKTWQQQILHLTTSYNAPLKTFMAVEL